MISVSLYVGLALLFLISAPLVGPSQLVLFLDNSRNAVITGLLRFKPLGVMGVPFRFIHMTLFFSFSMLMTQILYVEKVSPSPFSPDWVGPGTSS
jgi:hypothetical protein